MAMAKAVKIIALIAAVFATGAVLSKFEIPDRIADLLMLIFGKTTEGRKNEEKQTPESDDNPQGV